MSTSLPPEMTLASRVHVQLRQDIMTGVLKPGQRLRTDELAERYGAGASPLREALNRLAADGLAVQIENRGFRVPSLSLAELEDVTLARCWVQEAALRDSIAHGDVAWEEQVVLSFYRLSRIAERQNVEDLAADAEWETHHRAFHDALIARCRSKRMRDYSTVLFDQADRYRHMWSQLHTPERDVAAEHRAMMDAVLSRNVEAAVKAANEHILETAEAVKLFLSSQPAGRA